VKTTSMLLTAVIAAAAAPATADPTALGDTKWQPLVPQLGAKGPQLSVVFGDLKAGPVGVLLKFPAGFTPGPHTHSSDYWGITIAGEMSDFDVGKLAAATHVGPGGHWMESANHPHDNQCSAKSECVAFAYFPHGLDVKPFKP